jgi:hypothetical protein
MLAIVVAGDTASMKPAVDRRRRARVRRHLDAERRHLPRALEHTHHLQRQHVLPQVVAALEDDGVPRARAALRLARLELEPERRLLRLHHFAALDNQPAPQVLRVQRADERAPEHAPRHRTQARVHQLRAVVAARAAHLEHHLRERRRQLLQPLERDARLPVAAQVRLEQHADARRNARARQLALRQEEEALADRRRLRRARQHKPRQRDCRGAART